MNRVKGQSRMITSAQLVIKISAVWIANIVFIEYLLCDNYIWMFNFFFFTLCIKSAKHELSSHSAWHWQSLDAEKWTLDIMMHACIYAIGISKQWVMCNFNLAKMVEVIRTGRINPTMENILTKQTIPRTGERSRNVKWKGQSESERERK